MSDYFDIKGIGRDAVTHLKNEAQTTLNQAVDAVASPVDMAKTFIHIRDFYNFIRSSSTNVPAPFFYFSPNFYAYQNGVSEDRYVTSVEKIDGKDVERTIAFGEDFFQQNYDEFARFRYCIQSISFPQLQLMSYSAGDQSGQGAYKDISNIYGGYTILQNSYVNAANHTMQFQLLNTQQPVVENFIYPWLCEALRTDITDRPIPRVNMACKFWSPHRITKNMEGVKPDFIYYVTGLFPVVVDTWNPKQMTSDSDLQRKVTFAFNDFIILNSYSDAVKYNLLELFAGNAVNNMTQNLKNKAHDAINKLFKKKGGKDKKKSTNLPKLPNLPKNATDTAKKLAEAEAKAKAASLFRRHEQTAK